MATAHSAAHNALDTVDTLATHEHIGHSFFTGAKHPAKIKMTTDTLLIADELNISHMHAGRVARIRACTDIPAIVGLSVTAERHWRRKGSATLAELQAAAVEAVLAG